MTDAWGWRMKFGVVTPSTNTMVQPHFDAMRPPGVTNHIARMHIPDEPIESDDDFDALIRRIDDALDPAIRRERRGQRLGRLGHADVGARALLDP